MLVTAAGERYWPAIGSRSFEDVAPVLQYQIAQLEFDLIEARIVTASPLTEEQEDALRRLLLSRLPPAFRVIFAYRERIPRSAGGKYEDFVCEIPAALISGLR